MNHGRGRNNAVAAFIVTFCYLLCYASAYQYEACPGTAQIDNSWWNPAGCNGGIGGFGSLHFRWGDAPFSNETVEVESVTLRMRASSVGTDVNIYVWNGYSWSGFGGGKVDFLGDYVYDLTGMPGPYADGSFRLKLVNRGPHPVGIDSLVLEVVHESRIRHLTVEVRDCETNRRVDEAEVTVDGTTVETGSDGKAEFDVPKDEYYEIEIDGDDYYKITRGVYLEDDEKVEFCVQKRVVYAVEVDDLDVYRNFISFEIRNTGNVEETVTYTVKVNDAVITEGSVVLEEDEEDEITGSYDFPPGKHKVTARAVAGDYADAESVTHCVTGVTDNYICSGNKVVRETIKTGCVSYWEVVQTCSDGCYKGECTSGYVPPGTDVPSGGSCDVEIVSLNYPTDIGAGDAETVTVRVKNLGDSYSSVKLKLYVDGAYKDTENIGVPAGSTGTAGMTFSVNEHGTHEIKVEATACGSVRDTAGGTVTVTKAGVTPGTPQIPDVKDMPPLEQHLYIEVPPQDLDFSQYEPESLTVKVNSYLGDEYDVVVTGMRPDWLDYPRTLQAWGEEEFRIYLYPQVEGSYTLNIKVWNSRISADVDVEIEVSEIAYGKKDSGESGDSVTGLVAYGQSDWLRIALIGVIIAAVLIIVYSRFFMGKEAAAGDAGYDAYGDYGAPAYGSYSDEVRRTAIQ